MKHFLASGVCIHQCRAEYIGELASEKELSAALNIVYLLCGCALYKLHTGVGENALMIG